MPTAFFVTADAGPASCRVIGRVLNPWGHQYILYKFIHCTPELNRGDFCSLLDILTRIGRTVNIYNLLLLASNAARTKPNGF